MRRLFSFIAFLLLSTMVCSCEHLSEPDPEDAAQLKELINQSPELKDYLITVATNAAVVIRKRLFSPGSSAISTVRGRSVSALPSAAVPRSSISESGATQAESETATNRLQGQLQ